MVNIISCCRIHKNTLLKNGELIWELAATPLDDFLLQLYEKLEINYPKFYKMDRLCKLGFLGSEVLLSDQKKSNPPESTSVILSNHHASLDTDIRYWESTKKAASPSLFVYTLPNIVAGEICIRNGFKGESNFFVTPEFDPEWMTDYVEQILSSETMESCLAGWVDVLHDHAEVFLYLAGKSRSGMGVHSAENIRTLYHGRTYTKP